MFRFRLAERGSNLKIRRGDFLLLLLTVIRKAHLEYLKVVLGNDNSCPNRLYGMMGTDLVQDIYNVSTLTSHKLCFRSKLIIHVLFTECFVILHRNM